MSRQGGPNAARRRQIKARLAERDGLACFYCGQRFACPADATVDHLIPHSRLRTWMLANLVLACNPCNEAKADLLPQTLLRPAGVFGPGLVPALAVVPGLPRQVACRSNVRSFVRRVSAQVSVPLSAQVSGSLSEGVS